MYHDTLTAVCDFLSTFVEVLYEHKNVNSIVRVRVDTAGAHGLD